MSSKASLLRREPGAAAVARRRREDVPSEELPKLRLPGGRSASLLELQQSVGNARVARLVQERAQLQRQAAAQGAKPKPKTTEFQDRMLQEDIDRIVSYLKLQVLEAALEQHVVGIIENWLANDRLRRESGTPMLDKGLLMLKLRAFTRRTARSMWMETTVNAYDTLWYELQGDRLDAFKNVIAQSGQGTSGPEGENSENFWATLGKQEAIGLFGAAMAMGKGLASLGDTLVRTGTAMTGHEINPKFGEFIEKGGKEAGAAIFGNEYLSPEDLMKRGYSKEDAERLAGEKLLLGMSAQEIGDVGGTFIWKMVELAKGPIKEIKTAVEIPAALFTVEDGVRKISDRIDVLRKQPGFGASTVATDGEVLAAVLEITGALLKLAETVFGGEGTKELAGNTAAKVALTTADQLKRAGLIIQIGQLATQITTVWTDPNMDPEERKRKLTSLFMDGVAMAIEQALGEEDAKKT